MRLSLYSQDDLRKYVHYGYGKSFVNIRDSFRKYLYNNELINIEWNSSRAAIQLFYGPDPIPESHYNGQYKIHMSQHESNMVFPHKVAAYNNSDEVWTANSWGAKSLINSGVRSEKVFIYEHGLKPEEFSPFLRGKKTKIRFIHIDSGSPRKRSDLAIAAFNIVQKKYPNIELTIKYSHGKSTKADWSSDEVLESYGTWISPNVREITETLSEEDMKSLMKFHDVLIYPSEGEGFGLIPLEAIATGMPVISTSEWSSYSKFFIDEAISSEIKESTIDWGYPKIGYAVIANFDSIIYQMENVIENIDSISLKYYNQVDDIKSIYTWQTTTKLALDSLISRVGIDMLK